MSIHQVCGSIWPCMGEYLSVHPSVKVVKAIRERPFLHRLLSSVSLELSFLHFFTLSIFYSKCLGKKISPHILHMHGTIQVGQYKYVPYVNTSSLRLYLAFHGRISIFPSVCQGCKSLSRKTIPPQTLVLSEPGTVISSFFFFVNILFQMPW